MGVASPTIAVRVLVQLEWNKTRGQTHLHVAYRETLGSYVQWNLYTCTCTYYNSKSVLGHPWSVINIGGFVTMKDALLFSVHGIPSHSVLYTTHNACKYCTVRLQIAIRPAIMYKNIIIHVHV